MIKINTNINETNWQELFDLYSSVGLVAEFGKKRDEENIMNAFKNSTKIAFATYNDRLVGAGRLISDNICYGMIFDVGVLPEYQKKGIGKMIMNELLKGYDKINIYLTSTFGNEMFYTKLGFRKHKTAYAKYHHHSEYLE
ncbi:MAG: GNAT family N-acetyltransferase [Bacteroidetes bacterium]|nr:GNAT family N-acetyltransferase [Bacteroidota bacterium]